MTSVKAPYENRKSNVDGVLSIKDIFLPLLGIMKKQGDITSEPFSLSSAIGVSWAVTGGESSAIKKAGELPFMAYIVLTIYWNRRLKEIWTILIS